MNWSEVSKTKDIEIVRVAADVLDIQERDIRGRSPLIIGITNRMPLESIKVLLEKGVDLEAKDKLGDTALKKAVKFNQREVVKLLLDYGAELDSDQGILATAWNAARMNKEIADLLLGTKGAVRLTLSQEEQELVDRILYEESAQEMCNQIITLRSPVLLHAVVDGYNWDDGPEPMYAVIENPACARITLLDMDELMDSEYWLERREEENEDFQEVKRWKSLAVRLRARLQS